MATMSKPLSLSSNIFFIFVILIILGFMASTALFVSESIYFGFMKSNIRQRLKNYWIKSTGSVEIVNNIQEPQVFKKRRHWRWRWKRCCRAKV